MKILAIETSCDDTAAAVIEAKGGLKKPRLLILSNVSYSQVAIHKKFGGIVPNLASRAHLQKIGPTVKSALLISEINSDEVDLIAVTRGPGLAPSLLVGINFARALAYRCRTPIIGVNHMEGHIYSNWLTNKKIEFPALILVVSGGHTELVLMSARGGSAFCGKNPIRYKIIGRTVDDAAGEAFDKTARLLGLGFPGGPMIAAEALKLSPFGGSTVGGKVKLPRPMINSKDYNFSFSGLKTAVLYLYNDLIKEYSPKEIRPAMAAEVQNAIIDVLISKTAKAVKNLNPKTVMIAGGVSANKMLREKMAEKIESYGIPLIVPDLAYSTDNAAMIAAAGYFGYLKKKPAAEARKKLEANANLNL